MFRNKWDILAVASIGWALVGIVIMVSLPNNALSASEWVLILVSPLVIGACIVFAVDYSVSDYEKKLKIQKDEINFLKGKFSKNVNSSQGVSSPNRLPLAVPQTGNISSAPAYPDVYKTVIEPIERSQGWLHLKGSVLGFNKSELQDSHEYCVIDSAAVLIVADGAGSKKFSKKGADHCVKSIRAKLEGSRDTLASIKPNEWNDFAAKLLFSVSAELGEIALKDGIQVSELGSTCILVFASEKFVGCSHVGDGRAGYLDDDGVWKSLMTPFKGSEANATVFMTSLSSENKEKYILTKVIEKRVRAVVALSDGPESVCWNVSTKDVTGIKIVDPNVPAGLFFEKISNQLIASRRSNVSQDELDKLWANFLKDGNAGLAAQVDDKTIVFALRG